MTTPISTAPDTLDFADYLAKDTPLFGTQQVSSAIQGLVSYSANTSPFQVTGEPTQNDVSIPERIKNGEYIREASLPSEPFKSAKDILPDCIALIPSIFSNRSLALRDESLYGVNPYALDLDQDTKAKILAECRINPMYFFTITDYARRTDQEGYSLDLSNIADTRLTPRSSDYDQ